MCAGICVVKPGHYTKDTKLTIMLAVEPGDPQLQPEIRGSVQNPRRWLQILEKAGISKLDANDYLNYICDDLNTNVPLG